MIKQLTLIIILTTKEGPTLSLQQNINNDWLAVNK